VLSPAAIDKDAAYDEGAVLQCEMADRMLEHLDDICLEPQRALDLEAGTGYAIPELQRRFGTALEEHRKARE